MTLIEQTCRNIDAICARLDSQIQEQERLLDRMDEIIFGLQFEIDNARRNIEATDLPLVYEEWEGELAGIAEPIDLAGFFGVGNKSDGKPQSLRPPEQSRFGARIAPVLVRWDFEFPGISVLKSGNFVEGDLGKTQRFTPFFKRGDKGGVIACANDH